MINIEIPKEVTFDLPEGNFRASIANVKLFPKQTGRGAEDWVRILFQVQIPGMENLNTMAGRNFKLNMVRGSDLRNFLGTLLGNGFFRDSSGKTIDIEKLVGMDCEVKLDHYCGRDYEKPLVVVAGAHPPGSLRLTQNPERGGAV